MQLPFTSEQFLDVFTAYNTALSPFALLLWLISFALVVRLLWTGRPLGTSVALLLAVHWAWSGVAYHVGFFAEINPAARLFGALFLIQAVLFLWWGVVRRELWFTWRRSPRHVVAAIVLVYALLYPLAVIASGHRYPAMPTFGVPCPTAILTIGFLLVMETGPRWSIAAIPLVWTMIGGSAAVLLDMPPDVALLIVGALLIARIVQFARRAR